MMRFNYLLIAALALAVPVGGAQAQDGLDDLLDLGGLDGAAEEGSGDGADTSGDAAADSGEYLQESAEALAPTEQEAMNTSMAAYAAAIARTVK